MKRHTLNTYILFVRTECRRIIFYHQTPTIRIWFRHDVNSPFKYHRDCPCVGPWDSQSKRTYVSTNEIIRDLVAHREHFRCHHCKKGLFFPNSCPELKGENEEIEEDGDEEVEEDEVEE